MSEKTLSNLGDNPGVPGEFHTAPELSPFHEHLGDHLFLNKLALWNQPQLTGRHQFLPGDSAAWQWPGAAGHDPEG